MPLAVRRDVLRYLQIFNDYMDFKILPWSKHGYDRGRMVPVRKLALRLLKKEIVAFKQKRWDESHGVDTNGENDDVKKETHQIEQQPSNDPSTSPSSSFATRNTQRQELNRQKTSKGESYTEVITNTAQFPVPSFEDVQNWSDDSWLAYAAPFELEAYYREHPEKKPAGWVNPSESLKSREEVEKEAKEERARKLREMNEENSRPEASPL